jgi:hypothetical protein
MLRLRKKVFENRRLRRQWNWLMGLRLKEIQSIAMNGSPRLSTLNILPQAVAELPGDSILMGRDAASAEG